MSMGNPISGTVTLFGTGYPAYRLVVIGFCLIVIGVVLFVYRRTSIGLDLRAAIHDPAMASSLGVNVPQTYRVAFASGAGLAALAGGLIAPITSIVPGMGVPYLIRSFFVVIAGGAGSILGVVAGSGFIGGLESLFSFVMGGAFPQAIVLALAIIPVRLRPRGLVPA
jgi:branched-chain amino acid transport system permease protein/urea transport system permease protein